MDFNKRSNKLKIFERFSNLLAENINIEISISKGKHIPLRESDKFIVSYPRSGNKFCRLLLCNLIFPNQNVKPTNIREWSPEVYGPRKKLRKFKSPRYLKSHECFQHQYKKLVYLVRDPRSVAVSYFFFLKKKNRLPTKLSFSEFLPYFLEGRLDPYGSWAENVGSWLGGCGYDNGRFLLIRYEDLRKDTAENFKKILDFYNIQYNKNEIKDAIEASSFESTKKQYLEEKQIDEPQIEEQQIDVRKGDLDEWKAYFGERDHKMLLDAFGPVMEKVGYSY